jgi:hypothetical protein
MSLPNLVIVMPAHSLSLFLLQFCTAGASGFEILSHSHSGDSTSQFLFSSSSSSSSTTVVRHYSLLHPPDALRFASTPNLAFVLVIFSTSFNKHFYKHYYCSDFHLQIRAPVRIRLKIATTATNPALLPLRLSTKSLRPPHPVSQVPLNQSNVSLWHALLSTLSG